MWAFSGTIVSTKRNCTWQQGKGSERGRGEAANRKVAAKWSRKGGQNNPCKPLNISRGEQRGRKLNWNGVTTATTTGRVCVMASSFFPTPHFVQCTMLAAGNKRPQGGGQQQQQQLLSSARQPSRDRARGGLFTAWGRGGPLCKALRRRVAPSPPGVALGLQTTHTDKQRRWWEEEGCSGR